MGIFPRISLLFFQQSRKMAKKSRPGRVIFHILQICPVTFGKKLGKKAFYFQGTFSHTCVNEPPRRTPIQHHKIGFFSSTCGSYAGREARAEFLERTPQNPWKSYRQCSSTVSKRGTKLQEISPDSEMRYKNELSVCYLSERIDLKKHVLSKALNRPLSASQKTEPRQNDAPLG